jgi:hypothetical protein
MREKPIAKRAYIPEVSTPLIRICSAILPKFLLNPRYLKNPEQKLQANAE